MAMLSSAVKNLFDARISKQFFMALVLHPEEYKMWCDQRSSTKQYEKMGEYGELPMPGVVPEYENAPETHFQEGPVRTWTHDKYGFTVIASRECINDDLFNVVERTSAAMGVAMHHRLETQGAYDLNVAFTVNSVGASDTPDETLIATSHATFTGAGGSAQSNRSATDLTLGVDSLWTGIFSFAALTDRQDNPIKVIPRRLVIPSTLERTAIEILQSTGAPYRSTFEDNALTRKGLTYEIGDYLTPYSTTAWFLIADVKPIIFYMRESPKVEPEDTIRNYSRSWTIFSRFSHGPRTWYGIYGSAGSA